MEIPEVGEVKEIYQRIIAAISASDEELLRELIDPDLIDHNPIPRQAPGVEGFLEWMRSARAAFPDLSGTIEEILVSGDRVVGRVTWRGIHRGAFLEVGPTGKPVSFVAIHIVRFARYRAVEWWGVADLFGALQQVGATVRGTRD